MAQWLSWLERRPVTAEVESSSLFWVAWKTDNGRFLVWDLSSAGRASALQAEGHRFEPYRSHFAKLNFARAKVIDAKCVAYSGCIRFFKAGAEMLYAGVAELADAQDLKSCGGDIVPVRFRSPALYFLSTN